MEFLIVLLSVSMYRSNNNSSNSRKHNQSINSGNTNEDIFLQYLFHKSIQDMKKSYTIPNDSVFFSKIISVRLIKALTENALHYDSSLLAYTEQSKGQLLSKVYARIMEEQRNYLAVTSERAGNQISAGQSNNDKGTQNDTGLYKDVVGAMRSVLVGKGSPFFFEIVIDGG